jgi:GTP-binding protein HflX
MSNTPYNEALAGTLIDRTIREKIVLVAVALPGQDDDDVEASLDELALLVDTAGADAVARMVQRRDAPDHTW